MTFRSSFRLIIVFFFGFIFVFASLAPSALSGSAAERSTGAGGRLLIEASERMRYVTEQLSEAGQAFLAGPELFMDLLVKAQDPENLVRWGEMAGKVLLVLVVGLLAQWLARRLLGHLRRQVEDRENRSVAVRAFFAAARTAVDIVPIAAFAIAAYGMLPLTDPRPETRLIALLIVNASVIARLIIVLSKGLLVPGIPALRLIPMTGESVHYLLIWVRRIVNLSVYGYFILEGTLLMGMNESLYILLMKLLGFAITLMIVALVMQNKNDVAAWLRRHHRVPAETGEEGWGHSVIARLRGRFADFWHIAAIALVAGLFSTWALEIEGGVAFLATGFAMTLLVIVLTGLMVRIVHHGVDRLFRVRDELKKAYPGLETRANRYQPFVRSALKGVVHVVGVFAFLEVWGLGTLSWLFSPMGGLVVRELMIIAFIIAGAFLLWEIVSGMIELTLLRDVENARENTRKRTLLPLFRNVVRITLVVIITMLVLSQIGINIGPLLAGAGVIGLAVGFGAQTLVRDIITGAFILIEDAVSVGDWVDVGGYSGTVEHLTVRTITLRDLAGTVHMIPFGEVTTVTNYNRGYGYALIDAGVAYRENYGEAVQALQDVATALRADETWGALITGDLEVFGMNNLGDSAVEIRVRIKTLPMRQFAVRRAFFEKMKHVFDERGIEIPFPHHTIWFGTDKDGSAPPLYTARVDSKDAAPALPGPGPATGDGVRVASESEASESVVQKKADAALPEDRSPESAGKAGDAEKSNGR